jgi:hypothetical protein
MKKVLNGAIVFDRMFLLILSLKFCEILLQKKIKKNQCIGVSGSIQWHSHNTISASFSNQLRSCWGWKRTRFVLCSNVESELVPHDFTFMSNYRHESEIMGHST